MSRFRTILISLASEVKLFKINFALKKNTLINTNRGG